MDYQKQAQDFADKYGVKLEILNTSKGFHFDDDKQSRFIFLCKLKRGRKSFTFKFGQSIASGSKKPTMYDILTSLTKYDPESFEDFCSEFDYDTDSRKAEKIYKAVSKEWKNVDRLFGDILEELQEIQ